jgi:HlyD family secretion protein
VTRGPLEVELVEDGVTRVREKYVVTAPITGTLRRIEIHAGDPVKKGQLVARLNWFQEWRIYSPVSGFVLRVLQESEGDVDKGHPILEIGDPSDLEILLDVLTEKVIPVRPGAPVIIDKWGGPAPLHGKVSRIEPSGFNKISSLGVEEQRTNVIVQIMDPKSLWKNLGDNFHLEGRIIIDHKDNILKIPRSALFRAGDDWAVYRIENDKARITLVSIGVQGTDEAQILEGSLREGDLVIPYPSQEITDGVRIQTEVPQR